LQQRSEEWFAARAGKVTSSRVADVVAKTKTGTSASRANYMAELVIERLTGTPAERFSNGAMQWGTEKEPEARERYQIESGNLVDEIAFVQHPRIAFSGASPDGLVGDDGLIEIKCPNSATHIETLLSQKIPDKYQLQMLWQMACTQRSWCDFVSYDPRMPEGMQLWIQRYNLDHERLKTIEESVETFLAECAQKLDDLNALYKEKAKCNIWKSSQSAPVARSPPMSR
jgi:putative phage-type endonuclease